MALLCVFSEGDQREDVTDEFLAPLRDSLFKILGMKAPALRTEFLDTGKKGNVEVSNIENLILCHQDSSLFNHHIC